ncbi:MAG: helix-turn-helix domain-containing protein [Thermodesulfobacteriota bacterium]
MTNEKKYGRDLALAEGKPFIPYKTFYGGFLPEPVMESTLLTGTEKVCWAKLNQFAGKNGFCYPSHSLLANSIGVSVRQINRVLNGLVEKGFLRRKTPTDPEKGRYRSTCYYFLWHACFNDAALRDSDRSPDKMTDAAGSPPDMDVTTPPVADVTTPPDTDVTTPHDHFGIQSVPDGQSVGTPSDIAVMPPPVIRDTLPPGADGTRNGSYIKNHEKEEGNLYRFPSSFFGSTPSRQDAVVENEKTALLERYTSPQRVIIDLGIACLKQSRAGGILPEDVLMGELRRWNEMAVEHVIQGLRRYIRGGCYLRGKNETYLWAIIRNLSHSASQRESVSLPRPESWPIHTKMAFKTCMEHSREKTMDA